MKRISLTAWIFIGMAAGVVLGVVLRGGLRVGLCRGRSLGLHSDGAKHRYQRGLRSDVVHRDEVRVVGRSSPYTEAEEPIAHGRCHAVGELRGVV